jgi:hypothetical protein
VLRRLLGQLAGYAAFGAVLVLLSHAPGWRPIPPGTALVQIVVQRSGARLQPCRKLSEAELARRAPNMRAAEECPRGRSPVRVTLEIDGRVLVDEIAPPAGLAHDGISNLYRRLSVPAGEHRLRLRVQDDLRAPQRAEERSRTVRLEAGQVFVIGYSIEQVRL